MNTSDPMEILINMYKNFYTKESIENGQSFTPRPTDVFIDTYGKCGTTWVQQICHSLRSHGSLDFKEISVVCPWDIVALDCGQDLNADQSYEPRIFKSHEPWTRIAKANPPCKYIHVARDPVDAFVSFYHFITGYLGEQEVEIPMEEFCDKIFANAQNSGNIAQFYLEWFNAWKHENKGNILFLFFEDLKEDLAGGIKKVAKLMNIELTEELLAVCLESCSFKTMSSNKEKFTEHLLFESSKERLGLSGGTPAAKVRSGKVGSGKKVPDNIRVKIERMWEDTIRPELGFKTYAEMRQFVNNL